MGSVFIIGIVTADREQESKPRYIHCNLSAISIYSILVCIYNIGSGK